MNERNGAGSRGRNERHSPHTERWRAQLAAAFEPKGSRTELARFLCDGDEEKVAGRQV